MNRDRTVRPRWVWGGTATALLGCVVLAVGLIVLSWTVSVLGVVLVVVGGAAAVAGGILDDVRSGSVSIHPGHDHGTEAHQGVAPGDELDDPRIEEDARETDRRRRALEHATTYAPRPSLVPLAGGVLLLTCLFLLVSQGGLYPTGRPGQTNATRALVCAVVLGIAGVRLVTAGPRSHRTLASGFALLAGLALVLNGFLAPHGRVATAVAEVTCGLLACACAVVAGVHRLRVGGHP